MLKARQLGMTWICAAYTVWFCTTHEMKLVIVMSAKGDWAVEFVDRCVFIMSRLPDWLMPKVIKQNTEQIVIAHKGGNSTIKSLATTEAGAQSKTPDLIILDESCWNPHIKAIYSASKPGVDAADGRIIVISNSIKNAPGWSWTREIYVNSMKGLNDFQRVFMPWWDRPGRPKDFKDIQIMGGMDEEEFSEQYPETEQEVVSTTGGSYFTTTLKRHTHTMDGVKGRVELGKFDEYEFDEDQRGIIEVWRFPYWLVDSWDKRRWAKRYCLGSDISEGLGQDWSVGYVYDRLLHEFVARIRSNRVDAHTWGDMLFHLALYYENALICAERTGAGQTTIKRLAELQANQYISVTPDTLGSGLTKKYGWNTTHQSKHELAGDLKHWFGQTEGLVYCPILLDEASTFIKHDNGRLEHEDGKHDDCVIAAGCAIEADIFLEGPPEQIPEPSTGWLRRWEKGELDDY